MDTLGAFVDVNDSNLEIDTREEMRVLLDAMDGSNEIPEDMRDLIQKLIFDETPPSAKEILKLDSLLDAKTLEDLQNVRRDSSLGSTERIVACDDVVRRALQNLKVVMRMMLKRLKMRPYTCLFSSRKVYARHHVLVERISKNTRAGAWNAQ